jgi:hypothetical protein
MRGGLRGRKGSGEIREGGSVRTDRKHIMGMERLWMSSVFRLRAKAVRKVGACSYFCKKQNKGAGFVSKVRV